MKLKTTLNVKFNVVIESSRKVIFTNQVKPKESYKHTKLQNNIVMVLEKFKNKQVKSELGYLKKMLQCSQSEYST